MFKVAIFVSCLAVAFAAGVADVQQRQTDSEGSLGPENLPYIAPPPAPAPEPAGAGPNLDELYGPPKPYAFGYDAPGSDGRSSRSETSDGRRVTGSYTLAGADGVNRVVHYVADGDGFRASIITNEPGTEKQNPSGVIMETSQPKAEDIARALGPVAEPGPDAPKQYIGAPIPAMPSVGSYAPQFQQPQFQPQFQSQFQPQFQSQRPSITQGSASPAFDAQVRQEKEQFEDEQRQQSQKQQVQQQIQQQQQQFSQPQFSQQQFSQQQFSQQQLPAPLPAAPQPTKSSFSQQIVHSIPQAPVAQAPLPLPAPIAQAPLPIPQAPAAPIPVFRPIQSFAPQRIVSDYQPVLVQEIPRIAPLAAKPVYFQQQTFAPQPIPAPRPIQIQAPIQAPLPAPFSAPVQSSSFIQSQGAASQGVKSAVRSQATKSAIASPAATKSRFVAPSRNIFAPVRIQAPLPIPAPVAPAQTSFLASAPQGKTSLPSAPAPVKSAALSSGKTNGQRVLRPFFLTSTTTLAPAPARFEQSRNEADVSAGSSGFLSQVKDEQQKDAEDQYFKS